MVPMNGSLWVAKSILFAMSCLSIGLSGIHRWLVINDWSKRITIKGVKTLSHAEGPPWVTLVRGACLGYYQVAPCFTTCHYWSKGIIIALVKIIGYKVTYLKTNWTNSQQMIPLANERVYRSAYQEFPVVDVRYALEKSGMHRRF